MASATLADIRKSQGGISFGKTIFDASTQGSVTPTQITNILKNLGIKVPPGVVVTADVAQMLMAGGSFVSNVEAGASLSQCLVPATGAINSALSLLEFTGLLDPNSPAAQLAQLGVDTALVVASGGLNVLADVALVIDVFKGIFFGTDTRPQVIAQCKAAAAKAAIAIANTRFSNEAKASAKSFSEYQTGKINIFDLLEQIAASDPDQFFNFWPDFKAWLPVSQMSITRGATGIAHHGGFCGVGRSDDVITEYYTTPSWPTLKTDLLTLENVFLEKYILGPFYPYIIIQSLVPSSLANYGFPKVDGTTARISSEPPVYSRISLSDLTAFSLVGGFNWISPSFDLTNYMELYGITPHQLGYDLETILRSSMSASSLLVKVSPGLTINGIEAFTQGQAEQNELANNSEYIISKACSADEIGDIHTVLSLPGVKNILRLWGMMPSFPSGNYNLNNHPYYTDQTPNGYRNIQNYLAAISLADMFKNQIVGNTLNAFGTFNQLNQFFPTSQAQIETQHKNIQMRYVSRVMNTLARDNIASFFGTTSSKLKLVKPTKVGGLAKVIA